MTDREPTGSARRVSAATAIALLATAGAFAGLRRMLCVATVRGSSMSPTLADGDRVLVRRGGTLKVGSLVLFTARQAPDLVSASQDVPTMIKRIAALPGDQVPAAFQLPAGPIGDTRVPPGALLVSGDNPRSEDSRTYGYLYRHEVIGIGLRRLGAKST